MSNFKQKTPVKSRWRLLVLFVVILIILLQSIGLPAAAQTVVPAKPAPAQQVLTAFDRKVALTQLANVLAQHYVLPEMAAQLSTALLQAETAGRFHHLQSKPQFVAEVGNWLRSVGKDGHLGLELTARYGEVTHIRHYSRRWGAKRSPARRSPCITKKPHSLRRPFDTNSENTTG